MWNFKQKERDNNTEGIEHFIMHINIDIHERLVETAHKILSFSHVPIAESYKGLIMRQRNV